MINKYKLTTEHGISKIVYGEDMTAVRKDFEMIMPGVNINRIQFCG